MATDLAAVLSLFKELGVPPRLTMIFEGECLLNDSTAIALFFVFLGIAVNSFNGTETIAYGVQVFTGSSHPSNHNTCTHPEFSYKILKFLRHYSLKMPCNAGHFFNQYNLGLVGTASCAELCISCRCTDPSSSSVSRPSQSVCASSFQCCCSIVAKSSYDS